MAGTVNISRDLWDDEVFADEPFSEREAWVWLIAEASWKARSRRVGTVIVDLERGQVAHSTRFLSDAWKWSHSKVRRFLDRLKNRHMIKCETGTGVTVITICKYDKFQNPTSATDTAPAQQPTQHRHSTGTNEKKGERRDIREDAYASSLAHRSDAAVEAITAQIPDTDPAPSLPLDANPKPQPKAQRPAPDPEGFAEYWDQYPHRGGARKGRAMAVKSWLKAIREGATPQQMVAGALRYATDRQVQRGFVKNPSNWIDQKGWMDEIEPSDPPPDGGSGPRASGTAAACAAVAARAEARHRDGDGGDGGPDAPMFPRLVHGAGGIAAEPVFREGHAAGGSGIGDGGLAGGPWRLSAVGD